MSTSSEAFERLVYVEKTGETRWIPQPPLKRTRFLGNTKWKRQRETIIVETIEYKLKCGHWQSGGFPSKGKRMTCLKCSKL